jgi:hypothetical protein
MKPDLQARLERIAARFSAVKTPAGVRKVAERLGRELAREMFPVRGQESEESRRQRKDLEVALTRIVLAMLWADLPRKPK